MALTIKQLRPDSSFLLSFEPIASVDHEGRPISTPFRILLDPRLHETSTPRDQSSSFASLFDKAEPDIVIVSCARKDHCDKAALQQLPRRSKKTVILAERKAAKKIQSWKHFDRDMVQTLHPWKDPRIAGRDAVVRVKTPPLSTGGEHGEVTIAFILKRGRFASNHSAVGITYRPPPSQQSNGLRGVGQRSSTPDLQISILPPRLPKTRSISAGLHLPGLSLTPTAPPTPPDTPIPLESLSSNRSAASLPLHSRDRSISILFSPHGIPYASAIEPYATSHLVNEAALPLTALLHCFDSVRGSRWIPRPAAADDALGMEAGLPTACTLGARAWVSTHDGDKPMGRLTQRLIHRREHTKEEVQEQLKLVEDRSGRRLSKKPGGQTEVLALSAGEEVMLTSEGVCESQAADFTPHTPQSIKSKIPEWSDCKLGTDLIDAAAEPLTLLIQRDAGTE